MRRSKTVSSNVTVLAKRSSERLNLNFEKFYFEFEVNFSNFYVYLNFLNFYVYSSNVSHWALWTLKFLKWATLKFEILL